ncbi:2Fe-2S ferredoxin [Dietzia sp. UCD-THP]|uniref:Rieske 2Fe-2S domain-containing protein n=1 Tax=Dietzia sp. UCD-THP TaxID=1292020 RepID=UPI0003711267|nr:Rieske 2Fe-2S domain-containing protein [Dietzia sp. UCD-THP]EYT62852.1 2Fe-2S ferredoxin [Dietzia sp. UCD-THP]
MPKPPLPMKPTGWFQVAWSAEVPVGHVHRVTAFGEDLVTWRSRSGRATVMDAYCKHLGAHLGHGGTVVDETIQCPFHGWQWNPDGRNTAIPYADRPNLGRKIRTYPVVERNESIYIWHDLEGREPYFDVPDVFTSWDDGTRAEDYHPCHPRTTLVEERLHLHPQYVLENGVDFAHFEFVHKVPIIPVFTRQDFDEPVSYVDFTIAFEGSPGSIEEVDSGVEAINGGLGVAVTRSHGMVDNRTATCVTPVDDETCDVRFSVWIRRRSDLGDDESAERAVRHGRGVIEQFEADLAIWRHQKYSDPAALAPGEYEGFTALRTWATQFYPDHSLLGR